MSIISKKMNGIENGILKDDQINKSNDEDDDSDLDDDDDDEYDEYDKTLLENYTSCIDSNDEVDEFVIFRDTLQSKKNIITGDYEKLIIFTFKIFKQMSPFFIK